MRVLFLSPSNRLLGARKSLIDVVTHLPAGIDPMVVCPGDGELARVLVDKGVAVQRVGHYPWRKLIGHLQSRLFQIPALRRIARRFRPAIIHANEYHIVPQARRAAWACGAATVAHLRSGFPPRHAELYEITDCDRAVCVSRALVEMLREGDADAPIDELCRVVPNGIDVAAFPQRIGERSFISDVPADDDALVVGLFGLIGPRKNQLVAAEAVARANAAGAKVFLVLAGDAFKSAVGYGEELKRRLAQPDLATCARWLPYTADIARLYNAIDINLLVSSDEGFGRTLIEAGAVGLPSIGARIGGIPEVIVDGETGWIVPEGDASALANMLVEAWKNRDAVRRRGEAMRARVLERYTIQATVERLVDVWKETAGR